MRLNTLLALGAGLLVSGAAAAASSSPTPYNGTWSVQMATDSGICDRSYTYAIAIQDGNVRFIPAPGDSPASVSGRVGNDGSVNLGIHRGIANVNAAGRLQAKSGSGTWSLPLVGCSGRWTAQRRTTTAQVD